MRCFIILICLTLFLANECQGKPFFFHHFACNIICPQPFTAKGCVFCRSTGGNVASANAFGSSSDPKSKISASSDVNINNGSGGQTTTTAAAGENTASQGGETTTTAGTTASSATESTTASTSTESTTASTTAAASSTSA